MDSAYTRLAPHYNWLMEHVDYEGWYRYIQELYTEFNSTGNRVLELASGTCPFSPWLENDIQISVYTDKSIEMLKQAPESKSLRQLACDATMLPFTGNSFGLCLMIYDSVNYLSDEGAVEHCFSEVYRCLGPGGLFIFDITTEHNSLAYFSDDFTVEELESITLIRHSQYESRDKIQYNDFTLFTQNRDGLYEKQTEQHVQHIYPPQLIEKMAMVRGFTVLGKFDDMTRNKTHPESERIHFVLKK